MSGFPSVNSLLFVLFVGSSYFWDPGNSESTTTLTVRPQHQSVNEYEDVVVDCLDSNSSPVHWEREIGRRFPKNTTQQNGRLKIIGIGREYQGKYFCVNDRGQRKMTSISVRTRPTTTRPKPHSTPTVTPKPVFPVTSAQTTPHPFLSAACNGTQCGNDTSDAFECGDGKKINKSLRCNRVRDCEDGSDEAKCSPWPPKITKLPDPQLGVFCGDQEPTLAGTLILECEAVGSPVPLIKWKKYEGHVPSKCQQFSKDGRGSLTCPDFQQSDQGAYSCVAENSVESSESQPKSVAKCNNTIPCKGFKVSSADQIENCLDCYCSGRSSVCQGITSNLTVQRIPFPETKTEVFADGDGKIIFIPSSTQLTPNDKVRQSAQEITYCSLLENDFVETSLLKSYGRNINIPRHKGKTGFLPSAPDLIIRGGGVSLMYTFNMISPSAGNVNVRFWPGNWHHLDKTGATRKDLMRVLANVDAMLLRCEYKEGDTMKWANDTVILLESSTISNFSSSVSYVEKCNCPPGYDGLSCESCATGYDKKPRGNDFVCERAAPRVCEEGRKGSNCEECDASKGYFLSRNICLKTTCDVDGSISPLPDASGKCNCAEGVTGNLCHTCKKGFFSLKKKRGCLSCWCSGVTDQCNSSMLYKTVISRNPYGGYNSSDGRNFWLLPSDFNGNRLTSYGGHLNYTLRYKPNLPKQKTILTVEFLSVDDVTLVYTHSNIDTSLSLDEKSWVVPITEKNWTKTDKTPVTRGEFLTVLSKIKAIYIESPYHLSSGSANLTSTRLTSAASWNDDEGERAWDVEQCNCPRSHTGLSCESCSEGYFRRRIGGVTQCIKCNCTHCDPELGCLDCPPGKYRDNPMEEEKAVCKACPCNGNGKSCLKDDYGQIICVCKPGFTGMHCEKTIPNLNESDFTITIHPRRIKGKKVGTRVTLNCSYSSNEEMTLSARKTYGSGAQAAIENAENNSVAVSTRKHKNFEFVLDQNIDYVECYVHDVTGNEAGRVRAVVDDLVTVVKPVQITSCYSDRIVLKEDEGKDIICEATGAPAPMVNWYRSGANIATEKVDTTEGVHSIESASLDQNGTIYTCIAENSEGDRATCVQVLMVLKKCDVVNIEPKQIRVVEGKNFTLRCKSTVREPVSWGRLSNSSGEQSLPLGRHKTVNGVLEITNATGSDSGSYICRVNYKTGEINNTAVVTVVEKKIFPTAVIPDGDVTLNVGDTYEVTCVVAGKPAPTATWKTNGKFASNVGVSSLGTGDKKILKISGATVNNSGIYECESKSAVGSASAYILIRVRETKVKPRVRIFPSGNQTAKEYSTVSLECELLEGRPRPKLAWMKKSGEVWIQISDNPILRFQKISRQDGGVYKCEAGNSAGVHEAISEIDVHFAPEVNISEKTIAAHEGDGVVIKCSALGHPQPKIRWLTAPGFHFASTTKGMFDFGLTKSLMLVEEVISFNATEVMDGAKVSCIAENAAGSDNETTTLKLLQRKTSNSPETVERVAVGSYFELNCGLEAENVTWEKVGGLVGDECPIPNGLMFTSVQIQHNGTYVCKCDSESGGSCGKTVNLVVVGFVPRFSRSSKSYVVVPYRPVSNGDLRIQISFKPTHGTGALLHKGDDLDIYLKSEFVHVSVLLKKGGFHDIKVNKPVRLHSWHNLVVDITQKYVDIVIYYETSLQSKKTDYFKDDPVDIGSGANENFFLGGSIIKMRHARRMFLSRLLSFDGCISRLNINYREVDIVKEASYSNNVTLCNRCSEEDPCRGAGECLDAPTQYGFICVCPDGNKTRATPCPPSCYGRGCENQFDLCKLLNPCRRSDIHDCSNGVSNLQCNCAHGYSGATCETTQDYSFCVRENGFVRLPSNLLGRSIDRPEVIRMSFTLTKPSGMLLWRGDKANHLSIAASDHRLEYVYLNQQRVLAVYTAQELQLNKKHVLEVTRSNNTVAVRLNSNSYKNSTEFTTDRVSGDIYLGNVPNTTTTYAGRNVGLNGCIHYVSFGNGPKINLQGNELERLNGFGPNQQRTQCEDSSGCSSYEEDENDTGNDADYDSQ